MNEGKFEEVEKFVKGFFEFVRSVYFERVGIEYLNRGNVEKVEEI